MPFPAAPRLRPATVIPWALTLTLGLGWATREVVSALESAELVRSQTVTLDQVPMEENRYEDRPLGKIGSLILRFGGLGCAAVRPGPKQRFATSAGVVDEFKEPQIQRSFS
jgi:hypothetical protein